MSELGGSESGYTDQTTVDNDGQEVLVQGKRRDTTGDWLLTASFEIGIDSLPPSVAFYDGAGASISFEEAALSAAIKSTPRFENWLKSQGERS